MTNVIQYIGTNNQEIRRYLKCKVKTVMKPPYETILVEKDGEKIHAIKGEYILEKNGRLKICPEDLYEFLFPKQ